MYDNGNTEDLGKTFDRHFRSRDTLRSFYFSNTNAKRQRRLDLTKSRYYNKLVMNEKAFTGSKTSIMLIAEQGYGIRSIIKSYQRFGGYWKQKIHERYTPSLITNEHYSSQTRVFCFKKLSHPQVARDKVIEINNGSFIYQNDKCPNKYVVMSRDKLPALATGLADVAQLLPGITFPWFSHQPTKEKEMQFNKLDLSFCTEIACRLALR